LELIYFYLKILQVQPTFSNGSIDDVRIFNRSLTADEISSLYNDGAGTEETVNGVITLNSPTDNAIAYNNPVTFSASAEVSGGATLTNVTLYNNISGTWEANGTVEISNFPENDIVSYYRLDESSGTIIDGLNVYNGTYNGALYSQSGKINTAIGFDGVDDKVSTALSLANKTEVTLSAWIKTSNSVEAGMSVITERGEDIRTAGLVTGGSGEGHVAKMYVRDTTGGYFQAIGTTNITDNQWHLLTGTYNDTGLAIYVDGVFETFTAHTGITPALEGGMYIGFDGSYSSGSYFNGLIDEAGIWNRSLTLFEISELYNLGDGLYL